MKIKIFLTLVLLFTALFGFKYLRENGMVMPIKVSDLQKLKDQVGDIIMSKMGKDDVEKSEEVVIVKDKGIKKDSKNEEVIVGFNEEVEILKKEKEYIEQKTKEPNSDNDIQTTILEQKKLSPEDRYLGDNDIVVNREYTPSYRYLKKCGVCHGQYGTGFNKNKELLGGSILHYNLESMYARLLDFKEGELEGETMKKVVEPLSKGELRDIASEVMNFKK